MTFVTFVTFYIFKSPILLKYFCFELWNETKVSFKANICSPLECLVLFGWPQVSQKLIGPSQSRPFGSFLKENGFHFSRHLSIPNEFSCEYFFSIARVFIIIISRKFNLKELQFHEKKKTPMFFNLQFSFLHLWSLQRNFWEVTVSLILNGHNIKVNVNKLLCCFSFLLMSIIKYSS